ncbi:MAG TPA: 50S ribosomal protein L29 [Gammaproteobacteria bacterium]|jgi:large subunit ribosomal protein L29|nr:50S ribosomal protein L29 [Gammaproteobacteria bacterium]
MEVKELRNKTDKQLREELIALRKEQFNLRMQHAAGQMPRAHQIQAARKNIARVKTVLAEKAKAGSK